MTGPSPFDLVRQRMMDHNASRSAPGFNSEPSGILARLLGALDATLPSRRTELRRMHEDIIVAARRLTEATGARAVVLFGSRARGDATQDSDWDMCVLLPDDIRPGQFTAQTLHPLVADLDPVIQVYPMRKSVYDEARHDPGSVSSEVYYDGILISGTVDLAPRGMRP